MPDTAPNRYVTYSVHTDSSGNEMVSSHPVSNGTIDLVAESEKRKLALDERERDLDERERIITRRENSAKAREDSAKAREDAVTKSLLADAIRKMNSLAARMDALEEEENKDPDEDILAEPPGSPADHFGAEPPRAAQPEDSLPEPPDDPAQHTPGGELHDLPPKYQDHGRRRDQGDLPRELHEGAPPHSGNFTEPDPDKLAYPYDPKQVNEPTSVSLW